MDFKDAIPSAGGPSPSFPSEFDKAFTSRLRERNEVNPWAAKTDGDGRLMYESEEDVREACSPFAKLLSPESAVSEADALAFGAAFAKGMEISEDEDKDAYASIANGLAKTKSGLTIVQKKGERAAGGSIDWSEDVSATPSKTPAPRVTSDPANWTPEAQKDFDSICAELNADDFDSEDDFLAEVNQRMQQLGHPSILDTNCKSEQSVLMKTARDGRKIALLEYVKRNVAAGTDTVESLIEWTAERDPRLANELREITKNL